MSDKATPRPWHHTLHSLWTRAVGISGYDKSLWMELEQVLISHDRAAEALREIADLKPEEYAFPLDWEEQVAACEECKRWRGHPVQRGICNEHRRPLWARERWEENEEKRVGHRARQIARAALAELDEVTKPPAGS